MNFAVRILLLGCAAAVLLQFGPVDGALLAQETDSSRWTAARVVEANREGWATALRDVDKEIRELTRGWLAVAGDPARSDDDRIDAIVNASRFGRPETIEFCLNNLDLRLNPKLIRGDGDMLKPTPCLLGLYSLRWRAIPHLIVACQTRSLSKDATNDFAFLFRKICGPKVGQAILEHHMKKKHRNKVFIANANAIIDQMQGD